MGSFINQMDPSPAPNSAECIDFGTNSRISVAFGTLRLGAMIPECIEAVNAIEEYIQRILDAQSNPLFWRISKKEKTYQSLIGRLFGGDKLLLGFELPL